MDTVCYFARETDPEHTAVEGFIHSGCQVKMGSLLRWLTHPAIEEQVEWTPVTADGVTIYTAHPSIQQFLAENSGAIYYLKPPDGAFNNRGLPASGHAELPRSPVAACRALCSPNSLHCPS
jgi:hypothetical protein